MFERTEKLSSLPTMNDEVGDETIVSCGNETGKEGIFRILRSINARRTFFEHDRYWNEFETDEFDPFNECMFW